MLVLSFTELRADPARLANVLGPAALKRDHPTPPIDLDPPLAPGLRSVARIVSGFAELHRCVPPAPFLDQLAFQIAEGALERSESGTLLAYMISRSPFRTINALNARLGLDRLELLSESNVLSTDEDHPTIFRQTIRVTLPHDAPELNLFASATVIDRNIECIATTTALAVLKGMVLAGDFTLGLQYRDLPRAGDNPSFFLTGKFHASLG